MICFPIRRYFVVGGVFENGPMWMESVNGTGAKLIDGTETCCFWTPDKARILFRVTHCTRYFTKV